MTASNGERFNAEVLRAMAILYATHPRQVELDFHHLSGIAEDGTWQADDEAYTIGTMQWILENGLIAGKLNAIYSEVGRAQLTARAWGLLQGRDPGTGVQPLGSALVDAAAKGGHELAEVAEILMRRITGTS